MISAGLRHPLACSGSEGKRPGDHPGDMRKSNERLRIEKAVVVEFIRDLEIVQEPEKVTSTPATAQGPLTESEAESMSKLKLRAAGTTAQPARMPTVRR